VLIAFQLLLNFPNTPSVVQLLGLAPPASMSESQSLQADLVNAVASSLSDMKQESAGWQVPVTSGGTSMQESSVVESVSSSLDNVTNTASSAFQEAPKVVQSQQDAGGSGDAGMVKGNDVSDACCASPLYQTSGLHHAGGGDDITVSPVAVLSSQTEAQLQELFRQQQWHVRLNQMMQQHSQAPLVIGADTAASLLWHQQQQHIANPTTVSFAFCNDQVSQQQQQQVLLQQQQQQQPPPPPQTAVEMKYEAPQQQVQTKPASDGQQTQSPRQQKPRLIARGKLGNELLRFYM